MKTAQDPRHLKRREAVKFLFAETFTHQEAAPELVGEVLAKKDELDSLIASAAPAWPIEKLNKIDLAILRLAVYELIRGETPPKVVIDEAIELAKEFGSEASASFVNGVLGTIYKEMGKEKMNDEADKRAKIVRHLAEHIGVEPEDINDEDSLSEDLHMNPAEISDFVHSLGEAGFSISSLNLTEIETVGDLLEALGAVEL